MIEEYFMGDDTLCNICCCISDSTFDALIKTDCHCRRANNSTVWCL